MMRANLTRTGAVAANWLFWIAFTGLLVGYVIALCAREARVSIELIPHDWLGFADVGKLEAALGISPASARLDYFALSRPPYGGAGFIPGVGSLSGYPPADADWLSPISHATVGVHPLIPLLLLGLVAFWIFLHRIRRTSPRPPRIRRKLSQRIVTASTVLMIILVAGVSFSATIGRIGIDAEVGCRLPSLDAKTGDVYKRSAAVDFGDRRVSITLSATKFKDWHGISIGSSYSRSFLGVVELTTTNVPSFDIAHVSVHPALAIGVFAIVPVIAYIRGMKIREAHPRCPDCGYNLTGNVSGRCSECGAEVAV